MKLESSFSVFFTLYLSFHYKISSAFYFVEIAVFVRSNYSSYSILCVRLSTKTDRGMSSHGFRARAVSVRV